MSKTIILIAAPDYHCINAFLIDTAKYCFSTLIYTNSNRYVYYSVEDKDYNFKAKLELPPTSIIRVKNVVETKSFIKSFPQDVTIEAFNTNYLRLFSTERFLNLHLKTTKEMEKVRVAILNSL